MQQAIGAQARLGQGTGAAYRLVRELGPFIEADTVLYPSIWKPCTAWL
jgi:hypothetical protein